MKKNKDKKLKWAVPYLESLGNSKVTGGKCMTGSIPDESVSCTQGLLAANACAGGISVITGP